MVSSVSVLSAFFNSFTSIVLSKFFLSIFSKRLYKKWFLMFISFLVFFLTLLFVSNVVLKLVILIACTYIVSTCYDLSLYNKLLYTTIVMALSGLTEIIAGFVLMIVFSAGFNEIINSDIYMLFGSLLSKTFLLTILVFISQYNSKVLIGKFKATWLPVYILPLSTFIATWAFYCSMYYIQNDIFVRNLSMFSLLMLTVGDIFIIKFVDNIHDVVQKENRLRVAEELIKHQERQYIQMIEGNEKIVKIRHDYKNFVIGIFSLISADRIDDVKLKLEEELNSLDVASNHMLCGDSVIDTIINCKSGEAADRGVEIKFEYKNIRNLNVSGVDLAILLGNAIDNSIEACEELDEAHDKTINVLITMKGEQILIIITNGVKKNKDVNNLSSEKIGMHGYGIINMKSIAEKYGGTVTFDCENCVFTTFITLNNKHRLS